MTATAIPPQAATLKAMMSHGPCSFGSSSALSCVGSGVAAELEGTAVSVASGLVVSKSPVLYRNRRPRDNGLGTFCGISPVGWCR